MLRFFSSVFQAEIPDNIEFSVVKLWLPLAEVKLQYSNLSSFETK